MTTLANPINEVTVIDRRQRREWTRQWTADIEVSEKLPSWMKGHFEIANPGDDKDPNVFTLSVESNKELLRQIGRGIALARVLELEYATVFSGGNEPWHLAGGEFPYARLASPNGEVLYHVEFRKKATYKWSVHVEETATNTVHLHPMQNYLRHKFGAWAINKYVVAAVLLFDGKIRVIVPDSAPDSYRKQVIDTILEFYIEEQIHISGTRTPETISASLTEPVAVEQPAPVVEPEPEVAPEPVAAEPVPVEASTQVEPEPAIEPSPEAASKKKRTRKTSENGEKPKRVRTPKKLAAADLTTDSAS